VAPENLPADGTVRAPRQLAPAGYFDAASTLPMRPGARQTLLAALDQGYADPSRRYHVARQSRRLLDGARESIAAIIGARPDEVSFATSGTQAVHLAVTGLAQGRQRIGRRLLVSAVEHSCVIHAARAVPEGNVEELPVDSNAVVEPEAVRAAIASGDVALVAVQSANHEVGSRQPIGEIAEILDERGIPLIVDAAQSLGRDDCPAQWSILTASAHKWGGPAGVGILAIRNGTRWRSPLPDDPHEGGRIPGFTAIPQIVAAAVALEEAEAERRSESARLFALTERLRTELPVRIPDALVLGHDTERLPHIVTLSMAYVAGEALLEDLDREGFAVSSGSSCVADALVPSHVLVAMGALTHGNLRISLPPGALESDVDRFIGVLPSIVAKVRDSLGAGDL
jgi:cysteine desulfurase